MKAMNVLITGAGFGPTGSLTARYLTLSDSGLIMILHVDADQYSGGVVSIPPQAIVRIPGHGRGKIQDALTYGGPSFWSRPWRTSRTCRSTTTPGSTSTTWPTSSM